MSLFSFFRRTVNHVDPVAQARANPDSFGNIAIEKGFITQVDLDKALERQSTRIGQILIEMKKLTPAQCEEIVVEQEKREATTKGDVALLELRHQRVMFRRMRERLEEVNDQMNGGPEQEPAI